MTLIFGMPLLMAHKIWSYGNGQRQAHNTMHRGLEFPTMLVHAAIHKLLLSFLVELMGAHSNRIYVREIDDMLT